VHASFHFDWRTADEIAWKRKYLIWMKYVNEFFARGGILTAGADAGSLYTLYGFSIVRELELFQESGLHPLDIVQIASTNAARVLNRPDLAGGVRRGFTADLAIVDGNPLANFKLMYGAGVDSFLDDQVTKVKAGGVRWTIRAGTVFDARALMVEVEDYVNSCKATE
jgi:cytosine/adenosine deaminase-related metal-dependent hydrolase